MKAQPRARIEPHDLQQRTGAPHVTEQTRGASPRQLAKMTGALYLINIVLFITQDASDRGARKVWLTGIAHLNIIQEVIVLYPGERNSHDQLNPSLAL